MILKALNEYYERLVSDPSVNIPLEGFSREKVHFALVIDKRGELVPPKVCDLREKKEGRTLPKQIILPKGAKKSVNISANFMWGNTGYVLGKDSKGHKKKSRPLEMFRAFKKLHHELGDYMDNKGIQAVLKFLDSWEPENAIKLPHWEGMAGLNLVFQLEGEAKYIHDYPEIKEKWLESYRKNPQNKARLCLVSGKRAPIARLHDSIKGVRNAQSSGASIVSFNLDSFCSYSKEQNYNAPVSEKIAFNYVTALNYLLRNESRQKVQIGDATTVFWAEGETPVVSFLKDILDPRDNQENLADLRRFLEALREGKRPDTPDSKNMKFYILGLSPNVSRLSVRFWYVSSVEEISRKIGQHFKDLAIQRSYDDEPEYPGMWYLLHETAIQGKTENISPLLAGTLIKSIVTGSAYPRGLLTVILGRIRTDQKINYARTALIKAYLTRNNRIMNRREKEVGMSLDREEKGVAYRLGRLFAVLEKAQKDAVPSANTTIKDRFYGAASVTPSVVFPQLLRLAQHHIQKSEFGTGIDKQIEEVISEIQKFPAHLSLEEQGIFAIGYYHQKQDFYKKN